MKRSFVVMLVLSGIIALGFFPACGGGGGGGGNGTAGEGLQIYVDDDNPSSSDGGTGTRSVPFATIQAAVTYALSATTGQAAINVAAGNYSASYQAGTHIVVYEGISLYGGWLENWSGRGQVSTITETSTTGGTYGNWNRTVVAGSGVTTDTIIDGFSIVAGYGTQRSVALDIEDGGSPTVTNNDLDGGSGDGESVALWIGGGSSPNILDNMIDGGSGGSTSMAIYIYSASTPLIERNFITGGSGNNSSYGIFSKNTGTTPLIRNNKIDAGTAPFPLALRNSFDATPVIQHNTIDVHGGRGIYIYTEAHPVIENNIMYSSAGTPSYCVEEDNVTEDPASFRNNDLYNCGTLYIDEGISNLTLISSVNSLSDISTISGNISVDPELDVDGVHLTSDSQVKGQGLDLTSTIIQDIDSDLRSAPVDIGCDEAI